jgi:type I restriction enzyme, R subunit
MSGSVSKPERPTQDRVIKIFRDELGYSYLGDLQDKSDNSNIETSQLRNYLVRNGYTEAHINKSIDKIQKTANNHSQGLYNNNKDLYQLLRYGIQVKVEAGLNTDTVTLIDWSNPENNDFYVAEEVTVFGNHEKRPDVVLYVNGIAIAVLELKNSRVSIAEGIRQSIVNQEPEFIGSFFSTVQLVLAGNDTEGLMYGTIGTPEKKFLKWKEDIEEDTKNKYKLDKYLKKICNKERLVELLYDFVLFDAGVKKLPRVHQYFGIKAAQEFILRKEGGIIWHTQGSGKSIVMVLLTKWILENNPHARVVIVTDRDQLDKQIQGVFMDSGEQIHRTNSGKDLMKKLGQATPRLLCSLIQKFGNRGEDNFEQFIKEIENQPSHVVGEVFVLVDECHRTQSGKFHRTMKAIMPKSVMIGFSGTPLLKRDKATSLEVFGRYIHTYKYTEGVEDGVILDFQYEARDIDQKLSSQDKIDEWFKVKTRGLNDFQRAALKKKWVTMQNVLSSISRTDRIVSDIVFDFSVKPRLSSEKGNAILVASSIYDACRYYEQFQKTELRNKCAVITSYNPHTSHITTENTGANTDTDKEFIYQIYESLLKSVKPSPSKTKTETYEDEAKNVFINTPAQMKLLIVVDKLLTGFDSPSCTFLFIDKSMKDHALFQAICRVNRLDTDDKEFGFIVDYKDLFQKLENAVSVYTSELDYDNFDAGDVDIMIQSRISVGRERLDNALELLEALCENVSPPKSELDYIHYFCGNTEIPEDLNSKAPLRMALYKGIVSFVRAYSNIKDEMEAAKYSAQEISHFEERVKHYGDLREVIKRASGETTDFKAYEADMRHLLDTYIQAEDSKVISPFSDMSLIEIIVKTGIADAINELPSSIRGGDGAAETIENNIRSTIIKDSLLDPAYFEKMSDLLDDIIKQRKDDVIEYAEYLQRIADLAIHVNEGRSDSTPESLNTKAKVALYNNLNEDEGLALKIDAIVIETKSDGWRGNTAKENLIKQSIFNLLEDQDKVETIFKVIIQQDDY